jgi:hypothetical protein
MIVKFEVLTVAKPGGHRARHWTLIQRDLYLTPGWVCADFSTHKFKPSPLPKIKIYECKKNPRPPSRLLNI